MNPGKCSTTMLHYSLVKILNDFFLASYFGLVIQLILYICCCQKGERERNIELLNLCLSFLIISIGY